MRPRAARPYNSGVSARDPLVPRDELHAAFEARRELGADLEPEVVDAFLARIEQRLDRRLDERLGKRRTYRDAGDEQRRFALALISLAVAVPLTAIAVSGAGLVALLVVWLGIVGVNLAFARR